MTPIRHFRLAYDEYRHVANTSTDEVFLQRLEDDGSWTTLLRFSRDAVVFDARTGHRVGAFHGVADRWFFTWAEGDSRQYASQRIADSLLDSEVDMSRDWLARNPERLT